MKKHILSAILLFFSLALAAQNNRLGANLFGITVTAVAGDTFEIEGNYNDPSGYTTGNDLAAGDLLWTAGLNPGDTCRVMEIYDIVTSFAGYVVFRVDANGQGTPSTQDSKLMRPTPNNELVYIPPRGNEALLECISQYLSFQLDTGTGGGAGDVAGPASSTDNAITRFDGTTGKVIQGSGITIPDGASGELSGTNTGDQTATTTPITALPSVPGATNVQTGLEGIAANTAAVDAISSALVALSGRPATSTDLGAFSGTTIPDGSDNKEALQALETYAEADGDRIATNEGSLTVGAGGANSSTIVSNTSGSLPVTISGGANVTVTESGSTITIASSGGGGSVSTDGTTITGDGSGGSPLAVGVIGSANIGTGAVGATQLASTAVTAGSYTYMSGTVDADGRLTAASSGVAPVTGTLTANYIPVATGANTLTDSPLWYLNSNRIRSLTQYFQLDGDIQANRQASANAGTMFFNTTTSNLEMYTSGAWRAFLNYNGGNNRVTVWTSAGLTSSPNFTYDPASGKLGLGLSGVPSTQYDFLHPAGSVVAGEKQIMWIGRTTSAEAGIFVGYNGSGTAANYGVIRTGGIGNLGLALGGASGGAPYGLFVNSSNFVGIRNLTPLYALDITTTGGIKIGSGTTAQRGVGAAGYFGFNTTWGGYDVHDGTAFRRLLDLPDATPTSGHIPVFTGGAWTTAPNRPLLADDIGTQENLTGISGGIGVFTDITSGVMAVDLALGEVTETAPDGNFKVLGRNSVSGTTHLADINDLGTICVPIYAQAHDAALATGTDYRSWRVPTYLNGWKVVAVHYSLETAGSDNVSIQLTDGSFNYSGATIPVGGSVQTASGFTLSTGQKITPSISSILGSGHEGLLINLIIIK